MLLKFILKHEDNKDQENNKNKYNQSIYSQGKVAASLTSTHMNPITINEAALIDDNEYMYSKIKAKGYVTLKTNLGDLNFEIFCDQVNIIKY